MSEERDEKIWAVFVTGWEPGMLKIDVAQSREEFNRTTVIRFRRLLQQSLFQFSTGDNVRVLFSGKEVHDRLHNGKKATLQDYGITRNNIVQVVLRLQGGGGLLSKLKESVCDYS